MTTVRDIYNALFAFAPASMKMDWDNVGLLCGRFDAPVDTVLVALDPMPDVIDEAKKTGAQCIVTHHPLFFDAPRAVNDASCVVKQFDRKAGTFEISVKETVPNPFDEASLRHPSAAAAGQASRVNTPTACSATSPTARLSCAGIRSITRTQTSKPAIPS